MIFPSDGSMPLLDPAHFFEVRVAFIALLAGAFVWLIYKYDF